MKRRLIAAAIGFGYGIGVVALIGGLAGLAVALAWSSHGVLAIAPALGSAALAWALVPWPRRVFAPGIELFERDHPRLFRELRAIAERVGAPMPARVFARWHYHAQLDHNGLVLGLPLLATATTDELRSAIAHELGLFRDGTWLRRTQEMFARTYIRLCHVRVLRLLLLRPYRWFAQPFLEITRPIARAQIFAADQLAARVVGRAPTAAWLRKSRPLVIDELAFVDRELGPLFDVGVIPPPCTGLQRFIAASPRLESTRDIDAFRSRGMLAHFTGAYPPTEERIAALDATEVGSDEPANALVDDLDGIAQRWFEDGRELTPIAWADAAAHHERGWRRVAAQTRPERALDAPGEVRRELESSPALRRRIFFGSGSCERAIYLLGSVLMVLLLDAGFTADVQLAKPVIARKGDVAIAPFDETADLIERKIDVEAWRARWTARGLAR